MTREPAPVPLPQEIAGMNEQTQAGPDRSWTKGRIAMAVVMALAWGLVWYALLDSFGRARQMDDFYAALQVVVPPTTIVSIWVGAIGATCATLLCLLFVAGLAVMLWRMRGRVWVGYAVGTLLTLVVLVLYVLVILQPLTRRQNILPKTERPRGVLSSRS
jgi:hypothetical protein